MIETFQSIFANFEFVLSNHKKLFPFRSTQKFAYINIEKRDDVILL